MYSGKARIVALFVLALLLVGGSIGGWSAGSPRVVAADAKDSKVKELLKERLATLRKLVHAVTADYVKGQVSFDRVQQATRALLDAELEQCESDKERIKVLEKIVTLAKESEKSAEQRYKTGNAAQSDVLMATAARLEAEIALERAKGKPAAQSK
jgi:outer membrane protein TolC